jgi:hypothetical protein
VEWIGIFVRKYLVHHSCFLGNFYTTLLISSPPKLGTKNKTYNVLTLKCLGRTESNTLVIMAFKPLLKLRFGFGIIP